MKPQPEMERSMTFQQWWELSCGLGHIFSDPIIIWIRIPGTAGERFMGPPMAMGVIGGFLIAASYHPGVGVLYFWAECAVIGLHAAFREGPDDNVHSRYDGNSLLQWIAAKFFGYHVSDRKAKGDWDVFFLMVATLGGLLVSPGLGIVIGLGAVGWALRFTVWDWEEKAANRTRKDMRIEYQMATGNRPLAAPEPVAETTGAARINPKRTAAKRILRVCALILAWAAYQGGLIPGVPVLKIGPQFARGPRAQPTQGREERREAQLRAWRSYNRRNGY